MMHGEEQAKAFAHHNGSARMAEQMAAGALGRVGVGSGSIGAKDYGSEGQAVRSNGPSITTIVRSAEHADEMVGEVVKTAIHLAERAESIATRLAGPYPSPASSDTAGNRGIDPESSGFAAMQSAVSRISGRAMSAGPALSRLAQALDQIERTLG